MRTELACLMLAATLAAQAPPKPRARDLGVPFEGTTGPLNAITDVAGVEVGFSTLIASDRRDDGDEIVNALVAAETMKGADGRVVEALPHAALRELLKKYGR